MKKVEARKEWVRIRCHERHREVLNKILIVERAKLEQEDLENEIRDLKNKKENGGV